ncbi:disease resistance protein L6-like [Prosopis cineraria]|uniref:disease resistance protein L6-like n=1 Tax=Prosopis cineraria TaxID=364024 RepID=UPI0024101425|nr:disease resistance protein L6-like [Prosopis cineraria]XP_054788391.1 disease resistance protein L6-like [Prosopis cineraria]
MLDFSSKWLLLSTVKTDHIYVCDMQSIIPNTELPHVNKWNQVKVSIEGKTQESMTGEKDIYFGVHVYDLQSNLENIQFMDPRRYTDHNLWQKIQEQPQAEELEEEMSWDYSNSTKSAEPIQNNLDNQEPLQDKEKIEDDTHQDSNSMKSIELPENVLSYDGGRIFVSFEGKDTLSFMKSLYSALDSNGIEAFKDGDRIGRGDGICQTSLKEIEESKISFIIFSENYASSIQCLAELVMSLYCKRAQGTWVVPVFYKVDPSIVKHQGGSFGRAMAKHEAKFCNDMEMIRMWKLALPEAANIAGLVINDGNESDVIQCIVKLCRMLPSRIPSKAQT